MEIKTPTTLLPLDAGAEMTHGPICADGIVCWNLVAESTGREGWVAEGDAEGA